MDKQVRGGVSLTTALTIIFVIAKITGFITWPWVVVFLPVICQAVAFVMFLLTMALIAWFTS